MVEADQTEVDDFSNLDYKLRLPDQKQLGLYQERLSS